MKRLLCLLAPILLARGLTACGESRRFATIGTGGVTGVYYPVGGAIARLVNARSATYGIRVSVESTGGSVYNLNAVASGDLDFGMAQSDRHYQAWTGTGEWEGRPQTDLRSVLSLHQEIITLVAAEDADIRELADLRGRRVNLGNPGSGHRANALDILADAGIDPAELRAESLNAPEAPRQLQDDRLDAFFYTVGHPNGAIQEATAGRRRVRFVPIRPSAELFERFPFYAEALLPKDMYPQATNEEDTVSVGLVTPLVTSARVPEETVYAVTRELLSNLESFRDLHPALAGLRAETMRTGLTAPLHPGAERAFRELGLLADGPD